MCWNCSEISPNEASRKPPSHTPITPPPLSSSFSTQPNTNTNQEKMKLSIGSIFSRSDKQLQLKRSKTRSISRSASPSFGSSSTSSGSGSTPKTVLTGPDPFSSISRRDLESFLRRLGPDAITEDELSELTIDELSAIGSGPANGSELREAFDVFDVDKDGRISAEELLGIFESLGDRGCNLAECERIISVVDKDGDGFVGFEDFVRMMEVGL